MPQVRAKRSTLELSAMYGIEYWDFCKRKEEITSISCL
jgi:hypothetical protein